MDVVYHIHGSQRILFLIKIAEHLIDFKPQTQGMDLNFTYKNQFHFFLLTFFNHFIALNKAIKD